MRFLLCLAYVAVIAYIAMEIYLIVSAVELIGFWLFVLEVGVSALIGTGILATQFGAMSETFMQIITLKLGIYSFLARNALRFLSGILLILPFVLSDIFGIIFFAMSLFFRTDEQDWRDWRKEFERDFMRETQGETIEGEVIDAKITEKGSTQP